MHRTYYFAFIRMSGEPEGYLRTLETYISKGILNISIITLHFNSIQ